jgi:aspartate-semialdehyde dehydrogenase
VAITLAQAALALLLCVTSLTHWSCRSSQVRTSPIAMTAFLAPVAAAYRPQRSRSSSPAVLSSSSASLFAGLRERSCQRAFARVLATRVGPACAGRHASVTMAVPAPDGPKIRVGVLGCTGSVGQRFLQLLEDHPWFEIAALGASARSAGKPYAAAANWKQDTPIPPALAGMRVSECVPGAGAFAAENDVRIVFSGLDAEFAGDIEDSFAHAGYAVFSNARNHRMDSDVPILIPPVNAEHLQVIPAQRKARGYGTGFIVTNANCSTTAMAIGLKPIQDAFGIETIMVTTMQAISGAGYPGLSSMDMLDNVVPYIGGEEAKMESEPKKVLGAFQNGTFIAADINISAMCNRVHVLDGHTECISLKLRKPATAQGAIDAIRSFPSVTKSLGLPSAPAHDVIYHDAPDRPQPRMDRNVGKGFTVTVGRLRECSVFDLRLVLFGHNTIVGAAGGSILNAELCVKNDVIDIQSPCRPGALAELESGAI